MKTLSLIILLALTVAACEQKEPEFVQVPEPVVTPSRPDLAAESTAIEAALLPLPGLQQQAPNLGEPIEIVLHTDAGEVVLNLFSNAAPNAVQRFTELVESGFYDNTPISRVVPGFVAQFGINWRDEYKDWADRNFDDDPSYFAFEPGTIAFAKAGPNTNSTQVFINYRENNRLAAPGLDFSVFGVVVQGMEVVEQFAVVGDPQGGLDQDRLWSDGGNYLESLADKPAMILQARLLD